MKGNMETNGENGKNETNLGLNVKFVELNHNYYNKILYL